MILIIGLGNPGLKYKKTRHNAGFRVIEEFQKENDFPKFRLEKKIQAEISESGEGNEKIILAKPQTFMNNSGEAIKKIINHQLPNLIAIHDDVDLPIGAIKISQNISSSHNGVKSISQALKTENFVRIRIGIQPNPQPQASNLELQNFVLKKFSREEEKIISQAIQKSSKALLTIIQQGVEKAMNEYNKKIEPAT